MLKLYLQLVRHSPSSQTKILTKNFFPVLCGLPSERTLNYKWTTMGQ